MRSAIKLFGQLAEDARGAIHFPRLVSVLCRLQRQQHGVVAVIVALAATVLIGFAALGVETGLWYAVKRQNQSAADAAALAGAYERAAGLSYADICAKAQSGAAANGFTFVSFSCPTASPACTNPASGQMCANNPPVGGTDDKQVEVYLAQQQNAWLAKPFLSSVTIATHAVATVGLAGLACVLALNTTGTDIAVQGSATINLPGCGMAANSSASSSISFGGGNNDILNASWFQTVGNYNSGGSPQINVPTRLTYAAPVTDPFSCNPPQIGCAGQIKYTWPGSAVNPSSPCYPWSGAPTTLQPGLYGKSNGGCSKGSGSSSPPMSFTSGTTTLCPGVYYLDGEDTQGRAFFVQGGTVNMGTAGSGGCPANGINGVVIIASSQTANKGGGFQIQSGTVSLSAPTSRIPSGCTFGSNPCIPSGVLFYQDPSRADTSKSGGGLTGDSVITANSGTSLKGAMYTPATNMTFTGNSNSTCFIIIALTVTYIGDSTIAANQAACTTAGITGPTVLKVALTQ